MSSSPPIEVPDGDEAEKADGPQPPKEPPPVNSYFFRRDRSRHRRHRYERHDRRDRYGRYERYHRYRSRSRSREADLRKVSGSLCRMVRYEEHRPEGLDVDDEGRVSLNQLLKITNFHEKTLLKAVREHQYQDRSTGALRFSLEPTPDGKDMVIRVYPGRQQGNENWSRWTQEPSGMSAKAEVKEESWEGRWRQKSWWGRSWGKGDDMWAEG